MLTVPMIDHEGAVISVLQLVTAGATEGAIRPFSFDEERYIEALATQAGIALEKQHLIGRLQVLFEEYLDPAQLADVDVTLLPGGSSS